MRNPRLDGIRGIAILLVMLYHSTYFWLAEGPAEIALALVPAMGLYGVDLFFVLSGFLITGILLRTRGTQGYFRTFYARRTLRIFPLYYAVLVLFLLVLPGLTSQAESFWAEGADRQTFWYWAYLSNIPIGLTGEFRHHFLHVTWSLAIEEQFYLVWPLVVLALDRRKLAWLCAAMIGGALLLRCWLWWMGAPALTLYTLTPCRMDTLATGAWIAIAASQTGGIARLDRWARWLLPLSLCVFVGFVVAQVVGSEPASSGALQDRSSQLLGYTASAFTVTAGYTLLCVIFGAALVRALALPDRSLATRLLSWRPLVALGTYSYGLYLLHRLGIDLSRSLLDLTHQSGPFLLLQPLFWLIGIGVSFLLALAAWYLLEVHFLRLKRYFPYGLRIAGEGRPSAP